MFISKFKGKIFYPVQVVVNCTVRKRKRLNDKTIISTRLYFVAFINKEELTEENSAWFFLILADLEALI